MHLKIFIRVLDDGSHVIGYVYKADTGTMLKLLRKTRPWPIFKWITADFLTIGRLIIAVTNIFLFIIGLTYIGLPDVLPIMLGLTILAYATDYFDGKYARLEIEEGTKQPDSNFGSFIDNMADKAICIPSMFFVMRLIHHYTVPIIIIVIDFALSILRIVIARKYKISLRANHYGKFKTWIQGIGISFVLAGNMVPGFGTVGYVILFGAIFIGILSFLKHYRNVYPQIQELKRAQT